MWEPVGPLPASVYWRRRWLAIAATACAMVLATWSLAAIVALHSATGDVTTQAASRAALTAPQQATVQPGSASPGFASPGSGPPGSPGAPAATREELRPDDTPRVPVPVPPSVPLPPTGPVPCTNAMLSTGAEIDRPEHRVGVLPVLRLVITNVSEQPCVRDLDAARQEIVVWNNDLATRLWSSNDCANPSSVDLRTLVPGQPLAFTVTWSGRTTTPGCAQTRTTVPPGAYRLLTRLDDIISAPTPFVRSP